MSYITKSKVGVWMPFWPVGLPVHSTNTKFQIQSVTYENGRWIIFTYHTGDTYNPTIPVQGLNIWDSTDGITFTYKGNLADTTYTEGGYALYGNGRYVAVAGTPSDWYRFYSTDLITWSAPVAGGWYDIWFDGTYFLASTSSGVKYSIDGISWLSSAILSTCYIVKGNGLWVCYSYNGITNTIDTTNNLAGSWTSRSIVNNINGAYGVSIAYSGSKFLVILRQGQQLESTDGISWSIVFTAPISTVSGYLTWNPHIGKFLHRISGNVRMSSDVRNWETLPIFAPDGSSVADTPGIACSPSGAMMFADRTGTVLWRYEVVD